MSYCQLSAWPLGYECMELREAIRKGQISVKDAEKIVGSFVRRFNRELRKRGYEVVSHSSKQMLEYWGFGEPTVGLMAKAWLIEVIDEDVDCAELEREFENKLSEHIEKELPKYFEKHKKSIMFEESTKMTNKNRKISMKKSAQLVVSEFVIVPEERISELQSLVEQALLEPSEYGLNFNDIYQEVLKQFEEDVDFEKDFETAIYRVVDYLFEDFLDMNSDSLIVGVNEKYPKAILISEYIEDGVSYDSLPIYFDSVADAKKFLDIIVDEGIGIRKVGSRKNEKRGKYKEVKIAKELLNIAEDLLEIESRKRNFKFSDRNNDIVINPDKWYVGFFEHGLGYVILAKFDSKEEAEQWARNYPSEAAKMYNLTPEALPVKVYSGKFLKDERVVKG